MRISSSGLHAVFALAGALSCGCMPLQQAGPDTAPAGVGALRDSHWVVAAMEGVDGLAANGLSLDVSGSSIHGRDGCNAFTGTVAYTESSFTVAGPLAGTSVACPGAVEQQAAEYRARLQRIARYRLSDDRLELSDAAGKALIVLQPAASSPLGGAWRATFYNAGTNAAVSVMPGTRITAAFGTDGRITGNAGCNNYFATYSMEGDSIRIGPPGASRKACADPAGILDQETRYLQALAAATRFRLLGERLELRDANGALMVSFAPSAQ